MSIREFTDQSSWPMFGQAIAWSLCAIRRITQLFRSQGSAHIPPQATPVLDRDSNGGHNYSVVINVNRGLDDSSFGFERKPVERRSEDDRRKGSPDRRQTPIRHRMRFGFALHFFRATGTGECESIWRSALFGRQQHRAPLEEDADVVRVLLQEARLYKFQNGDGAQVDPKTVLEETVGEVWKGEKTLAVAVDELSTLIFHRYQVTRTHRRVAERRGLPQRRPLAA